MQINSTITVPFVPLSTSATGTKTVASSQDDVQSDLQISSPTFTSLVQEAKSYPEVRSEVVAAYKAQISSGHYPPVDVISGLANLLSGDSD